MKMLFCRRPATSITLLALLLLATLASPVRAEWVFREEAIMGTRCAVELWSEKPAEANKLIDQVFAEFRRIDLLMSTYKPASQVSRVILRGRPVRRGSAVVEGSRSRCPGRR